MAGALSEAQLREVADALLHRSVDPSRVRFEGRALAEAELDRVRAATGIFRCAICFQWLGRMANSGHDICVDCYPEESG